MIIIGRNPVTECLLSEYVDTAKVLYIQTDINIDPKIDKIISLAEQARIRIEQIGKKQLDKFSSREPHQGVALDIDYRVPNIDRNTLVENPGLYFYVREAQYEHNLGAIARTAEVAQIAGLIIPPKQDITPVTARVSMGAVFHLPIYQGSLFPTMKQASQSGYLILGVERGGNNLFETEIPENTLLIVGGEDKELSEPVIEKCDGLVSIPQHGKINSLNMSVASAIAIYEYRRQHPLN